MKILSFDIGIKNLAYCLIEIDSNFQNYDIKKLEIINLVKEEEEKLNKKKGNNFNLIDIGKNIKFNLNKIIEENKDINLILIENQIGPLAKRMSNIQCMIMQFFLMKEIDNIKFVSSQNKLKNFTKSKLTYIQRKKLSIEVFSNIISKENIINPICKNYFLQSKKKDDLSDCFLQGLWYINENKLIK